MLNNLKVIYLRSSEFAKAVRVIGHLRQLAPEDVLQRRDLGVCLIQTGQPGPAIDHLMAYLAILQPADGDAVRKLLEKARAEVAKWN